MSKFNETVHLRVGNVYQEINGSEETRFAINFFIFRVLLITHLSINNNNFYLKKTSAIIRNALIKNSCTIA